MPTDPNTNLAYALLALDSYNRGYGTSVRDTDDPDNLDDPIDEAKIGDWVVIDSKKDAEAEAIGCYAIAYRNETTGEIVIAYRGTDNPSVDILQGYGIAIGSPTNPQAIMAMEFFNAVTGRVPGTEPGSFPNVVVTGHSMGGGIAG